jgi:hypothetical protein
MPLKFILYKIAPVDINETLWNNEADLLLRIYKRMWESRLWRQDEESITEHQGSQNEPLWELKWPLSACSG